MTVEGAGAAVLLQADLDRVGSADVHGVRFLPPFDPYLLDRDRSTLVADKAARQTVWRAVGNPGVVLADAEPVATWRSGTRAGRVTLTVDHLAGAPAFDVKRLREEAQLVGAVLGARGPVEVATR